MVRPSTNCSPRSLTAWRMAWRMNGSPERATRRFKASMAFADWLSFSLTKPTSQHQAPGGGVDEKAVGMAAVPIPVSVRNLFGNEGVGGLRIGDAQQGLGEAHQDDALFARKSVLAHEGVDAAMLGLICAGVQHDAAGDLGRAAALVLGVDSALDETRPPDDVRRSDGGLRFRRSTAGGRTAAGLLLPAAGPPVSDALRTATIGRHR